jgi:iron complex transport system substrate-binding protein
MPRIFRRTILATFGLCLAALMAQPATAEPVELTDVIGRKVKVDIPAKRIMLGFYFEDYMAIGGPDAFDRVVGISKAAWKDWRPANWAAHLEKRPSLDRIPDVGEVEVQTFSVEKVLALKPDVAILGNWQAKALGLDVQRLTDAGVPVIVVDYHAETLERHLASTRLIGKLIGAEARAEEIARANEAAIRGVEKRIAEAGRRKPRIYLEFGGKGPGELGNTFGDSYMWGALATAAGGDNIGSKLVEGAAPISPEKILAARPEVVVITGSEWRTHATAQLMGQGIGAEEARDRLVVYAERSGWMALPAVRNGRVYAVYHGASRTVADYTMVQHLAKLLYPDLFADIDPIANYLAFYERYLPIKPEGTFALGLQ